MKNLFLLLLFSIAAISNVAADDQAKAEKQLSRLNAMASDPTGRKVVSISMSDSLTVKRGDLVQQRRELNLNYGSLFLARQMLAAGLDAKELAAQMKAGKTTLQIANDRHLDWKQVQNDAKKLNGKVEKRLYEHFVDPKEDNARDKEDNYSVVADSVAADSDVSQNDVDAAADVYDRLRTVASQRAGSSGSQSLNTADSLTFRRDHAREGAPDASQIGAPTSPPH